MIAEVTPEIPLFAVTQLDQTHYRGQCLEGAHGRAFGGQLAAQALIAATNRYGPCIAPTAFSARFLSPTSPEHVIDFYVATRRVGRRIISAGVTAIQRGTVRMVCEIALADHEEGREPAEWVDVPRGTVPLRPSDIAPAANPALFEGLEFRRALSPAGGRSDTLWLRTGWGPCSPAESAATRVYTTDLALSTVGTPDRAPVSVDHCLWFHTYPSTAGWLRFTRELRVSSTRRGFARGELHTHSGSPAVSVAQEFYHSTAKRTGNASLAACRPTRVGGG